MSLLADHLRFFFTTGSGMRSESHVLSLHCVGLPLESMKNDLLGARSSPLDHMTSSSLSMLE